MYTEEMKSKTKVAAAAATVEKYNDNNAQWLAQSSLVFLWYSYSA